MPLIPWKPFEGLDSFFDDEHWLLPVAPNTRTNFLATDIYETDTAVVAEIALPNIDPEKIDITVEDGMLLVQGSTEEKKEEKKKGYWKREIRTGSFERRLRIPTPVKKDNIEATYEKGIVKITMPKLQDTEEKSKKVKIKEIK